jgi:hypothetical protein
MPMNLVMPEEGLKKGGLYSRLLPTLTRVALDISAADES